ncbi:methyltransferase domain-containing protein [Enterococcus sp. BWM-S5]|uniref:Methyltransferase domain-containing protein n=1 Tax=Enterococcus larvae TaxID=2794352 RepID=A0ABS4CKE8_9ENTE|nr:methyltransferase [Enterococcus larvae]MBP1046495.1 methyltransferase domain-containing protein [Enterococcus larvae]
MKNNVYHDYLVETWRPIENETVFSALELGLFDDISHGLNTPEKLSSSKGYHLPTIERVLLTLKNLDFLKEVSGEYQIGDKYSPYILKESPFYNGDIWLLHKQLIRDLASHLSEMIVSGQSGLNVFASKDSKVWESAMPFLNSLAKISAKSLIDQLKNGLLEEDNLKILDLGCGTGIYTTTLLKENESWEGFAIDIDSVIQIAKDRNEDLISQKRMTLYQGDIFDVNKEVPEIDLVILSNVMHGYNDQENIELLKTVSHYLKPSGKIIVNEFMLTNPSDNLESIFDLFFSLVGTGSSFTPAHLLQLFDEAGYKKVDEISLSGPSTVYCFANDKNEKID